MYRLPSASGGVHQLPGGGIPATTTCVMRSLSFGASGTVLQLPAATIDDLPAATAERLPTDTGVQFDPSDQHLPAPGGVRLGLPSLSQIGAFAPAEHGGPCAAVLPGAARRLVLPSAGDAAPRVRRRRQDAALLPAAGDSVPVGGTPGGQSAALSL
jgi:hypothetical protein